MDPLPSLGGCDPSCQMQSKWTLKKVPVWTRSFKRPLRSTQPSQMGCSGPKNGVSRPLLISNLGYGLACLEKQQVSIRYFQGSKNILAFQGFLGDFCLRKTVTYLPLLGQDYIDYLTERVQSDSSLLETLGGTECYATETLCHCDGRFLIICSNSLCGRIS